jgi:predicted ATP-grasp superfamily ATP-dependent carboligase
MEEYSGELVNAGFIFYYNEKGVVKKITSKRGMHDYSLEFNYPSPLTCFPSDDKELIQFLKKISYPIICKPEFSKQWLSADMIKITNWQKVIVLKDEKSCLELFKLMNSKSIPVIFQEIVKGDDDELLYQITHISKSNEVLNCFIGKKNRITPVHFGSASYVETVINEELSKSINKFLLDIGFKGISGVEVKYDYNSKNYKLIEINPRYGLWDELGEHIGKDIALNAYNDLTDEITSKNEIQTKKIYWFSIHRDASAFVEYNKKGLLSLKEFLKTYKCKPRIISDLYTDDFKVSIMTMKQVLKSIIKYLLFNKLRIKHS